MDESLALLAKRAGRRLDHSRIAYDRINHWKKLARVDTTYIWHSHCLVHIFKFISVVDACFFANSCRFVDLVVTAVYTRHGVTWRPPEQPCLAFLRMSEHKLWANQRGLFTPDQDQPDDEDPFAVMRFEHYSTFDRSHHGLSQTGTWSAAESALANIKRRRIDYRYEWYQIYKWPQFSSDDYESQ